MFTSPFAIEECRQPVYPGWKKVVKLAEAVPVFDVTTEITGIIEVYLRERIMPANDVGDAAHLAVASYNSVK